MPSKKKSENSSAFVVLDDGRAEVVVKTKKLVGSGALRPLDAFGRPVASRVVVHVDHHDGYGVLVSGTCEVSIARKALEVVGYDWGEFRGGWRPTMIDQEPRRWPFGLWVGGTPAVAFYFEMG